MSPIKAIKIGLPVATATSAAIATTSLVSFSKRDEIQKEEDLDKELSDLSMPDEKYEDKELFYSKDGDGKNQEVLDKALAEKLSKLLKEKGDLSSTKGPTPNLSKKDLENVMANAPNSQGKGVEHNDQQGSVPLSEKEDKKEGSMIQSHSSEVDDSESPDEGGFSTQMPVAPKESDMESEGSVGNDGEVQGEAGEPEKSNTLSLSQEDESKNGKTQHSNDGGEQGDTDSSELNHSSIEGKAKTEDVEKAPTSATQTDTSNDIVQKEEGAKDHGKEISKGDESPDSSDTVLRGQDDNFIKQHHTGIDSTGNGQEFTEEDLKKLGELGDQLSSVSGELMSLISD